MVKLLQYHPTYLSTAFPNIQINISRPPLIFPLPPFVDGFAVPPLIVLMLLQIFFMLHILLMLSFLLVVEVEQREISLLSYGMESTVQESP